MTPQKIFTENDALISFPSHEESPTIAPAQTQSYKKPIIFTGTKTCTEKTRMYETNSRSVRSINNSLLCLSATNDCV